MTKPFYFLFIGLLLNSAASNLTANNITVSNTKLTGQNTTDDNVMVQFDISRENSGLASSAPGNWDAALVCVKRLMGIGDRQHTLLSNTVLSEKDFMSPDQKSPKPVNSLKMTFPYCKYSVIYI